MNTKKNLRNPLPYLETRCDLPSLRCLAFPFLKLRNWATQLAGVLLLCLWSSAQLLAQDIAKVYVGGGDEHTGAYDGYLNDPNGWTWVRQHADGYYVNTFPMSNNPNDANQNAWMGGMAALFTNKNVFYETESEAYLNRVFDADDKARISILQQNGWNLTYTTINGGYTNARKDLLQHWSGNRPLLTMQGPWVLDGDINSSNPNAVNWRTWISQTEGSATDSPLAIWASNQNNCRNGSYSGVKYAHSLGKKAMIMMCPHGLGTDANWLSMGKQYIRDHEDNDAMPDIWVVSYYAAYLEAHTVTPEQVGGQPNPSVTGLAYYLIHHLKDPNKTTQLAVPAQAGVSVKSYGADLTLGAGPQSFQVNLANSSSWLDLIPAIKARINDPQQAWNISYKFNNQDVTTAITGSNGLVFYQANRVNPGNTKVITVTISVKPGKAVSSPLAVYLDLMPHPTVPLLNQTIQLQSGTQTQSPYAGVITIPGTVESENFDNGGEGIAFHDTDGSNLGNEYRTGEGVDIQSCAEGGYNVGWTNPGEWLEYTINVTSAGSYTLATRLGSTGTGSLHVDMDGANVSGNVAVPNTGGFQTWQTINTTVNLTAGQHIMRVTVDAGNFNLNKLTFTSNGGIVSGQTYRLTARHSGKVLDVSACSVANGANVQQWSWLGGGCQRWKVEATDNGYYRLTAQHSNQVLEVSAGGTASGDNVQQWSWTGTNWQQWKIEPTDNGYYKLTARHSGLVLDVSGISTADGANVHQWGYVGGNNQQWKLEVVGAARVGVEESASAVQLSLGPNPAHEQVQLNWEGLAGQVTLNIVNAQGQSVHQQWVKGSSLRLSTAAFTPGLYFIQLRSGKESVTKKLLIQR
jgi:hypothetical protein